ncbi:MAG: hypothetical protein ACLQPH_04660 [Acidimicrobiales bacterium]
MSEWTGYEEVPRGVSDAGTPPTLFSQTMGLVAVTAGLFALGAHLGRTLSYELGFVFYLGALICLIAMRFAAP